MKRPLRSAPDAILFDIDGTLIIGSNSHFASLEYALKEIANVTLKWKRNGDRLYLNDNEITGWVDRQLWNAAAAYEDIILTPGQFELISHLAAEHYKNTNSNNPDHFGTHAPGATNLLNRLSEMEIPYTLSTGNVQPTAQAKLEKVHLDRYFQTTANGGYGDQDNRNQVALHAAKSLLQTEDLTNKNIWLVGDTIADMTAATVNNFTPIGVSYGAAGTEKLLANGAAKILTNLEELIPHLTKNG
jgi:phosphoglycolate phosphatase